MRSFLVTCLLGAGGFFGFKSYFEPLVTEDTQGANAAHSQFALALQSARDSYQQGHLSQSIAQYQGLLKQPFQKELVVKELSQVYREEGQERQALTLEYQWAQDKEVKNKVLHNLEELNKKMMNPHHPYGGKRHVIQPNETLAKIAQKYESNERLLKRVNQIQNPHLIHAGQAIKVIPIKLRCEASLRKKELHAYTEDGLYKVYPIGVGTDDNPTPVGTYTVDVLLENPAFYSEPGQKPIPSGDSRNPLGSRWLGFSGDYSSYGIHGTSEKGPIQKQSSKGCIRMAEEDVQELFDLTDRGMEVVISE